MLQYSLCPWEKLKAAVANQPPLRVPTYIELPTRAGAQPTHLNQKTKKPRCDNKNKNGKQLETASLALQLSTGGQTAGLLALSALELGNNTKLPSRSPVDTVGQKGSWPSQGNSGL